MYELQEHKAANSVKFFNYKNVFVSKNEFRVT